MNDQFSKNIEYQDICEKPITEVNIAYNNNPGVFQVIDESMVKYDPPLINKGVYKEFVQVSYDWEILSIFFQNHNISTNWIDCNGIVGFIDEGKWTGAVGKVNENEKLPKNLISPFLD